MLPLNSNQIPTLFRRAGQLAQSGKPDEALKILAQIQTMAPSRGEVPFQIAQIQQQMGRIDKALEAYEKAAKLAPAEPAVWRAYVTLALGQEASVRSKVAKQLKSANLPAAERKKFNGLLKGSGTKTSRVSKTATKSEIEALTALINTGRALDAEKQAQSLLTRGPNEAVSMIYGVALAALGKSEPAEAAFKTALAADPDYGEALAQYGQFLAAQSRRAEARTVLEQARRIIPNNPIVLGNLGRVYTDINAPQDAIACLDALLKQSPHNTAGLFTRAQARLTLEDAAGTLEDLDALAAQAAPTGEILALRAMAEKILGNLDASRDVIGRALEADPDHLRVITMAANLYQQSGDFDAAEKVLRGAVARGVKSGGIYRMITQGRKLSTDDPIIDEMKTLWERPDLPDDARIDLGYGLVKVMEDQNDAEAAWTYLSRANELMSTLYPHDATKEQGDFDRFTAFLKGFDASRIGTCGYAQNSTIFITGLPRSGTTLVEQILASHSTVTGGDELGVFHPLGFEQVAQVARAGGTISDMTDAQFEELGRSYQDAIDTRLPGADRITDKTISTYQIAPLVWLAMPKAKIVALRRDPRDNLWSIFKNRFLPGLHRYSNSQAALVQTYRLYTEYLDLWRELAPDRIYEISYEDLVENPETEIRKLLQFCDLEWEDACLDFHKTKRDVKTLSVAQVRQPLYKSSVGKWEPYAKHLSELLDGLKTIDGA
ncbi:Tetratricopeptide repeat-containing protein [Aliiroseovarius halocynthiae]|uniref:Tetratricopeptide repeat protein n=1 Tax=Aliiroseovarius halocynthiae TaxID=985055 RepID=A0A545SVZ8_9RHOB|nr:tetratricopeptide repeat-containing sulfotransferase family protein [Aliiroseovarius halocynthiae]TQV69134.1 tetratricopeptide repeat protein [Aliiroseovarius halocynthiae]SMR71889.1 Tetratricopeptide repeat-containing protein [Aliiroseovarius halocynthiae]